MVTWKAITMSLVVFFSIVQAVRLCRGTLTGPDKSTGWISIGNNKYKIYFGKRTWAEAADKCKDLKSNLAVFVDNDAAMKVRKYLSMGKRASLTAWIDNVAGAKDNRTKKCLMLNQQIGMPFEARPCHELKSYICYKNSNIQSRSLDVIVEDGVHDIIRNNYGYRVFHKPTVWENAKHKCETYEKDYGAKLAEPRTKEVMSDLKSIISRKTFALEHIWLGGSYEHDKWWWISDNQQINIDSIKEWLHNASYCDEAEHLNTCLNMDRDNFNERVIYGTDCFHPQVFICSFPVEKLKQLQKDEKEHKKAHFSSRRVAPLLHKKNSHNSKKI